MPEPKRPLKVFLCYAHRDQARVRDLYNRLTKDGVDVWLDKEKLLPGQDWELEIQKAVRESDVVIVCLSQQFNQRGFRQKEVRLALDTAMEQPEGEIFVIPARLEECDTLEGLKKWHWVNLFEENGYEKLLRALRLRTDKLGVTLQIKNNQKILKNNQNIQKKNSSIIGTNKAFSILALSLASVVCITLIGSAIVWINTWNKIPSQPSFTEISIDATSTSQSESNSSLSEVDIANTIDASSLEIAQPEMILVPSGEFTYVLETKDYPQAFSINPLHLESFYIDKYEVTNKQYEQCVLAGVCIAPEDASSRTHSIYYGNSDFDDFPVVFINWDMAKSYCEWREARLPTTEEWDKSARGEDGNIFLGSEVDCESANYLDESRNNFCSGDTSQVGSYPNDISPYGVFDMAGNVWEWVANDYSSTYSKYANLFGYEAKEYKLIRGGAWIYEKSLGNSTSSHPSYYIGKAAPDLTLDFLGFRCAKDATP